MRYPSPIVVVPDLHQDIDFLTRVLQSIDRHAPAQVVFLGDYFDSYEPELEDEDLFREYCKILGNVASSQNGNAVFLWGNHDLPYYLARYRIDPLLPKPPKGTVGMLSQFTWKKAEIIEEELGVEFWRKLEIATTADGFLLSHAGMHRQWLQDASPDATHRQLSRDWNRLMQDFKFHYEQDLFWLVEPIIARGGSSPVGGPLWLDWPREFQDIPGLPQIVGHSRGARMRQKGESFCIDCCQTGYAVLQNGKIEMQHE